jgi:hypothetical protein
VRDAGEDRHAVVAGVRDEQIPAAVDAHARRFTELAETGTCPPPHRKELAVRGELLDAVEDPIRDENVAGRIDR